MKPAYLQAWSGECTCLEKDLNLLKFRRRYWEHAGYNARLSFSSLFLNLVLNPKL